MPRKYKRKTDRGSWDEEKTKLAIGAVKSKLMDSMKPARASQRQQAKGEKSEQMWIGYKKLLGSRMTMPSSGE